ncbi:GNAT family N-acetyltransferase [Haloferula sp. BvORR071]|uniref:GNAT family N-acetyltransferase n=1 Tax=Haloferula sp. BvORR071 TaxID=1396141 RepID=UPI0006961A25|nr:GNAT family N-acetyltransferase [Haloferula sp. BvORR071]
MNPPLIHILEGPATDWSSLPAAQAISEQVAGPEEKPDARLIAVDPEGRIATAALWWSDVPAYGDHKVGTIGGFESFSAEASAQLLEAAEERLREAGCTIAIGPMNANTWRRHRFVIESSGRGPFLLEPRNNPAFPEWWRAAGYQELSRYSSSLMPLDGSSVVSPTLKERLERSGIAIRPLHGDRYDDELRAIYAISLRSFANNFLYTPLEEEGFLGAYRKVQSRVDPDFVRIAEKDGVPCGFVFAIADLEAAARGEKPALIVKTLAVDPESRCAGLGSLLVDEVHRLGREKGFTEAIHALQHENNTSLKITGRHHGDPIRRYALFSKLL